MVASACSSTTDEDSADEISVRPDASGAAAAAVADAGAVVDPETGETVVPAGTPPASGAAPAPSGPADAGTGTVSSGEVRDVPTSKGISDTTIEVGIPFADTAAYNTTASALGGTGGFYETDDPKGIQNAVIDYMNSTGGIAGRKVVPVWFEVKVQNAVTEEGRTQDAQAACAAFTEDRQVFAIVGSGQWTEDNIIECAARTKTLYIDQRVAAGTGVWVSEKRFREVADYYYTLTGMLADRRERAMAEGLNRQGFFRPDTKVGLLTSDSPSVRDGVDRSMKPYLQAHGIPFDEAVYPDVIESPWQTYVLRFRDAGVTHVIFSAAGSEGMPGLLFMRAAEDQLWRPQYGISSLPAPWLTANAPKEQLRNAKGIGWIPGLLTEPTTAVSPNDATCRQIMKKGGYPEDLLIGAAFCDFFFFLRAGLERASALTPAGFASAVAGLGTSWQSVRTFGGLTRFGPERHDASEMIRNFAWNETLGRFDYTSDPYSAP